MNPHIFKVKVSAENACFTRPEMKVERVSYDVITPSAARGVLEAIHWKPAIRWVIKQIDIVKPIKWESVRRNEVGSKASVPSKKLIENGEGSISTVLIDEDRQQRASLILKDVEYVIHAYFLMTKDAKDRDNPIGHTDQFLRRLKKGQCHHQPYLGCREFSAYFEEATEEDKPSQDILGDYFNRDLGWMLYDIDYKNNMQAHFFRAEIQNGSIQVPYPEEVGIKL